jgi:hypothetical protein
LNAKGIESYSLFVLHSVEYWERLAFLANGEGKTPMIGERTAALPEEAGHSGEKN